MTEYTPLFNEEDEDAIRGMEATLLAVDALLFTLIEEIQRISDEMRRHGLPHSIGEEMGVAMGTAIRLAITRQTLEGLREAIPQAILYGDARPAARIIA